MKPKITAFSGIFEDKLHKLVKRIKKLRKDKASKSDIKVMIEEAKTLKKLINKPQNRNTGETVEIALAIDDGKVMVKESCSSHGIHLVNVRYVGGLLIVDLDVV